VHSDHEIFIEAIEKKRIIKLTYSLKENLQTLSKECAPLHYSKGRIDGDDLDSYYIWDLEAVKGDYFMALPASQIISIEMSDKKFNVEDFTSDEKDRPTTLSQKGSPASS